MKNYNKKLNLITMVVTLVVGLSGALSVFAAGPVSVDLQSAGNFVILAKAGISTTGTTLIVGNIGVSPVSATYITGFALSLPVASSFSTSPLVIGKVFAPDYANPTPVNMTTAIGDMENAYTNASGRTNPTATELGAGNIGGLTLAPGLYKWGTSVIIPSNVTLSGSANDVWIFQIAQNLNISSATKVILNGGAQAGNIFWVVAGQTTIGTGASFVGNILDKTAIVLNTGATLNGRALAQTAVTLDSNAVTISQVSSPAIPATPAIAAVPTVVSAIPAVPATPSYNSQSYTTYNNGANYVVSPASPTSIGGIDINQLRNAYNANLTNGTQVVTPTASNFGQQVRSIAANLGQGGQGNDVSILQKFLISQNKGPASVALGRVGATAYFGVLTRRALAEFQASVGISPALGNFGSITRSYISRNY
jgi:hypothetical protein